MVELRLAAQEQYPQAHWLSRRVLSHAYPAPSPLPDALLTSEHGSVAILAKPRGLPRRQLERKVLPLIGRYQHILLVVSEAGKRRASGSTSSASHASVLAYRRDPHHVTLPRLPDLAALQPPAASDETWPMPRRADPCGDFPTSPHT